MKKILKPNEIKQPLGAAKIEPPKPEDWEAKLGATEEHPDINPEADWRDDIIEYELQRNDIFDNWSCVTFTLLNKVQCIIKHQYDEIIDWSKRYVSVGSGTIAGQGNSVNNPCEFLRKSGTVWETNYPTMTPSMTSAEFFKPIPADIKAKECFLKDWQYNHEYLPRYDGLSSKLSVLQAGLKKSPIMVSVEGYYSFDAKGRVIYTGSNIAHEVLLVKLDADTAYILDSENADGLVPFDIKYKFHYPKVGYVKKLNFTINDTMKMTLIRDTQTGEIFLLNSDGVALHIYDMDTFVKIFGQEAADNKDWNETEHEICVNIPKGPEITIPVAPGLIAIIRAFKEALKNFGKKN